jgi:hypothetical protein
MEAVGSLLRSQQFDIGSYPSHLKPNGYRTYHLL